VSGRAPIPRRRWSTLSVGGRGPAGKGVGGARSEVLLLHVAMGGHVGGIGGQGFNNVSGVRRRAEHRRRPPTGRLRRCRRWGGCGRATACGQGSGDDQQDGAPFTRVARGAVIHGTFQPSTRVPTDATTWLEPRGRVAPAPRARLNASQWHIPVATLHSSCAGLISRSSGQPLLRQSLRGYPARSPQPVRRGRQGRSRQ
jgi:hypothetical protein